MRVGSNVFSWFTYHRFKAVRNAIAAGAVAGLAVLGACSDDPVASNIAGPSLSSPRFGSIVGTNAHKISVCVDPLSSTGTYNFGVSLSAVSNPLELPSSSDPDLSGLGVIQNSLGPFIPGDQIVASPGVTPGNCADVFIRNDTPLHDNNRMWNFPGQGIVNPYGQVDVTYSIPLGATATLVCTNDDPNLPQDCTNPASATSSANVFHGSTLTYKITVPQETPCPAGSFSFELADAVNETGYPSGGVGDLLIKYDQFPAPNDNSYGVNAVGWPNGHTFGNLVGSDKAGVQIKNAVGTVVLSFNMDQISQDATAPSGYRSLGVTGGEGGMVVGTATGIQATTSLSNNLNNINIPGLFNPATHVQLIMGASNTNVLVNSPPTDPLHQTYNISDPAFANWDFHNTFYARISAAKLASMGFNINTWTVEPNLTVLHNSPAKPCPSGPFPCADITVGTKTVKDKEVKIDVNNMNNDQDAFITGVHITWPQGTNGALKQIKVGGDVIWSGTNATGTANLALADLASDANKRKIGKHSDEDIKFVFANNASSTLANYTASLDFGDTCNKLILP